MNEEELLKKRKPLPIDFDDALAIAHEVKGVKKAVENLDFASTISIDNVDVKTDNDKIATDSTLALISNILTNINDSIKAINVGDVSTLYDLVSDLQDSVSQIEDILKEDFDKISNIETRLDNDENNISEILVIISGLQDNVSAIVEQVTGLQSNLTEIVSDVESVKSSEEHIESDLTLLNNLYQTILTEVEELKEKIANIPSDVSEEIEELKENVSSLETEINHYKKLYFTSIVPLEYYDSYHDVSTQIKPYVDLSELLDSISYESDVSSPTFSVQLDYEKVNSYYAKFFTEEYFNNLLEFIFNSQDYRNIVTVSVRFNTTIIPYVEEDDYYFCVYDPISIFSNGLINYPTTSFIFSEYIPISTLINWIKVLETNYDSKPFNEDNYNIPYIYVNGRAFSPSYNSQSFSQNCIHARLFTNLEFLFRFK